MQTDISKTKYNFKENNNLIFLDSEKFECVDDKKDHLLIEDDVEIINIISNIIEEGKLMDIMGIPYGNLHSNQKPKFNNIIYYDENSKFINYINRDSEYFEKINNGAFILCSKLESLELVKEEIIQEKSKDKNIEFNLIVTGSKCEAIMNYLKNNKMFDNCIKNICVYCMHPENYQHLKKYGKINDIYKTKKDVANFIKKNSKEDISPFPLIKLLTYEEYVERDKERHVKISEFYGNLDKQTYEEQYLGMKNLIEEEDENNGLITKNKTKLFQSILTFDIKEDLSNLSNSKFFDNIEDIEDLNILPIKAYTENYLYKDLNKWLLRSNKIYIPIAYFTARLMYHLNTYALKNDKYYNQDEKILYRGVKMKYSCLLQYKRAEGKIIALTSFTSTSEIKENALKFCERKNKKTKEVYNKNKEFSVLYTIKARCKEDWKYSGINVQEIAKYNEKEILFLPFSFFYVEKVDIYINKFTADIKLETIGKTEIFEEKLKKGKEVVYDGSQNIMRFKDN